MRTSTNHILASALLVLAGGALSLAAMAQQPTTNFAYAVESGGDGSDTALCTVTVPCTISKALDYAGQSGDVVAVRVRRPGDKAVLTSVTLLSRYVQLAVYNEIENPTAPHLIEGNVELRGSLDMTAAAAALGYYADNKGRVEISASKVTVRAGGISGISSFAEFAGNNNFRGNVVFTGTTTLSHSANASCVVFQQLRVASSGRLTIEGPCSDNVPSELADNTGGTETAGVTVWNVLDVAGQLMLSDGLNLNLIAPRPRSKADSAFSAPDKLPGGNVSGSITGAGTFYLAVEEERVTAVDTIFYGADADANSAAEFDTARVFVRHYIGWPNAPWMGLDRSKSTILPGTNLLKSDKIVLQDLLGDRFKLGGSGSIFLDLMKTTQAGVEISPSFGNGGTSANQAGVLVVHSSAVRGHFVNGSETHRAQTEFVGSVRIDNDLIVESFSADAVDATSQGGIGGARAEDIPFGNSNRECYGTSGLRTVDYIVRTGQGFPDRLSTTRGLTTGVYFRGVKSVIGGAVEIRNGFETADGCYGGLYAMKPLDVTYDVIGRDMGTGAAGNDYAHFMIEGNLTLEGDFDMDAVSNVVTQRMPAENPGTTGRVAANLCKGTRGEAPYTTGVHIVFRGGQSLQQIMGKTGTTIDLGSGIGIRVDKATSAEVEIAGPVVKTQSVDIRGGLMTTNGMLHIRRGNLHIHQEQGAVGDVVRGTGDTAYHEDTDINGEKTIARPGTITYTGSLASMDTGDELYEGMSVGTVEMYLGTASTELALLTNIRVSHQLVLSRGTLALPNGIKLASPSQLVVGEGHIDEQGGTWITAPSGTITFVGETSRTTGNFVPAYTTMRDATDKGTADPKDDSRLARVVVEGCAGSQRKPMTLTLQTGYTNLIEGLDVLNSNKVNLNGNSAVVGVSILVEENAWLCDSGAGVPCSKYGGAAYGTDLNMLANALEAVHYSDTPERHATLAAARAAYAGAGAHKSADAAGTIHATGPVLLNVQTSESRLAWHLPAFAVERKGTLTVFGGGTRSTTTAPVLPNRRDELTFAGLTLVGGSVINDMVENGGGFNVAEKSGLDRVMVMGDLALKSHSMVSIGQPADGNHPQTSLVVGGDLTVGPASSVRVDGQVLSATGDYMQGTSDGQAAHVYIGQGTHYAMGSFYVGPDTMDANGHASPSNFYFLSDSGGGTDGDFGTECHGASMMIGGDAGYRVNAGLWAYGDYAFMGSGDAYDGDRLAATKLGLRGTVTFAGTDSSTVMTGGLAAGSFCHVEIAADRQMHGAGTVVLGSDVMQNIYGTLMLRNGKVHSADHSWMLSNPAIEDSLVGRTALRAGDSGVVIYGSRDSYFSGAVSRAVSMGNQGGGLVTGGYLFPVGTADESDYYRPLILQFAADLGNTHMASVSVAAGGTMAWPEDNLTVPDIDGGMLILDNVADMFWKVELDNAPAHDPNVRLAADGLPNVFDIGGLRIVQWDCDGANPRLAGLYDLDGGDYTDDGSMLLNDFLNGVPNLTQEGVDVGTCNIFGIASNYLQNPISADPITSAPASVQFIDNVYGMDVDVYLDDTRVIDNFAFQTARGFGQVAPGTYDLDVVSAAAPDRSQPLYSKSVRLRQNGQYQIVLNGNAVAQVGNIVVRDDVRLVSTVQDMMDFYLVHGASGLGSVDVRLIDPVDNTRVLDLLANNFRFGDFGPYLFMKPDGYNIEVTTASGTRIDVFRMEARSFGNKAFVLTLSGPGASSADGVTMMGVEPDGETFFPSVITAAQSTELPAEFKLLGNYPNPFNPSTQITFDLPESARVAVTVYDMLGRSVLTVPAKEIEAGVGRSVQLDGSSLASGSYFYRITAAGDSGLHMETGRMVLVR